MNDDEIKEVLAHFGARSQIDKACEECAELVAVLLQHREHRRTPWDVCAEIADVGIMLAQLRVLFGPGLVDGAAADKRARLLERVRTEPEAQS